MKAVILAGGKGSRISEESVLKPKPMIEIGGRPVLWHILKTYSRWGVNDFIILLGYKGWAVKEYFADYFLRQSDLRIDLARNAIEPLASQSEKWNIILADTGLETMTGARIKRARKYIGDEPFFLTYGDGLADVDVNALLQSHRRSGRPCTVTMARPEGRFGALEVDKNNHITAFTEKPLGDGGWINAGFFVCEPAVFDYIPDGDAAVWEKEPLETLAREGKLNGYAHEGFWKPMDTLRDKIELERLWESGRAPWKVWE